MIGLQKPRIRSVSLRKIRSVSLRKKRAVSRGRIFKISATIQGHAVDFDLSFELLKVYERHILMPELFFAHQCPDPVKNKIAMGFHNQLAVRVCCIAEEVSQCSLRIRVQMYFRLLKQKQKRRCAWTEKLSQSRKYLAHPISHINQIAFLTDFV